MGSKNALGTSTCPLCTSTCALQTDLWSHETSKRPGAISDLSGRLWKPKNIVKYKVFIIFHVAPQTSSRSSKSAPWESQNDPQEAPRSGPTPQERPRRPQDGSKSAKSVPGAPPEPPKDGFRTALAATLGPTGTETVQRSFTGHFGPPAGRFCILRGSIFLQFSFLGKHSQSCPVGKACASLRPAPLYLLV